MDCHNRPSHQFAATAERAVDLAIANGELERTLPFIRREAVRVVKQTYPTQDAAFAGIASSLTTFYSTSNAPTPPDPHSVTRAIAAVQRVYGRNVFPTMAYLQTSVRACSAASLMALLVSVTVLSGTARAQTIVLNQTGTQVTDTTIRSGSYANTNLDDHSLITRRSTDPDWERRSLLKFDTETFIPPGSIVQSATLTLTVKSGLGTSGSARTISAYREPSPFQEAQATCCSRWS